MFQEKGVVVVDKAAGIDEDKLMEDCLDAGALDFNSDDEVFEVFTEPNELSNVRKAMENKKYAFISAEVEHIPANYIRLETEDDIKNMNLLLENLDDDDDVQNVWHNWESPDED